MATLVRWDPFREVAALQNEMGRLFGMLREGNGQAARSWVPALDVWENDNEMVYAFDLPGIPEDEISVEFEDGSLTVSAERERAHEVSDERYYRFERHFGTFSRTIGLPQGSPRRTSRPTTRTASSRCTFASPRRPSRAGSRSARASRRPSRARPPRPDPRDRSSSPRGGHQAASF